MTKVNGKLSDTFPDISAGNKFLRRGYHGKRQKACKVGGKACPREEAFYHSGTGRLSWNVHHHAEDTPQDPAQAVHDRHSADNGCPVRADNICFTALRKSSADDCILRCVLHGRAHLFL